MSIISSVTAKEFLQIPNVDEQDVIIPAIIAGVEAFVSEFFGTRFFDEGNASVIERVPGGDRRLWLSNLPILTVTSIEDIEDDETEYDLDDTDNDDWSIWKVNDGDWDVGHMRWRVTTTAGYSSTTIPEVMKLLILQLVYRQYHQRGENTKMLMTQDLIQMGQPFNMKRKIG